MFSFFSSKPKTSVQNVMGSKIEAERSSYFGYIPGMNWATINIKNVLNMVSSIGITGRGFTVNGLNFSLSNIPKNLRSTLWLLVSACQIIKTRAENVYFTNSGASTNYLLTISDGCDTSDYASPIMKACNATVGSATSLDYNLLYQHSITHICGRACTCSIDENFFRAVNNPVQILFENCIKNAMNDDVSESSGIWKQLLIVLGSAAGILLLGACLKYKCSNRSITHAGTPLLGARTTEESILAAYNSSRTRTAINTTPSRSDTEPTFVKNYGLESEANVNCELPHLNVKALPG